MVWLLSVALAGGVDVSPVTACPNRRLRTNASIPQPTGESTGVVGRSVANGPSPNDANTPCTSSRMVDGAVDSGPTAETACGATRSVRGDEIVAVACLSAGPPLIGAMLESGTAAVGALTTLCALTRIEAAGSAASLPLVGGFPTVAGELVLEDEDGFGAAGGSLGLRRSWLRLGLRGTGGGCHSSQVGG